MTDYPHLRELMVAKQIARRGIDNPAILDAMCAVPREEFIAEAARQWAYEDCPLPIEEGQTISQPYIVAAMIDAAAIGPGDRVLEVGAGSGYAAAILGQIADRVFAIERHESLARRARERMIALGYANVDIRTGDGTKGLVREAPFDAILVAAAGPDIPTALKSQLAPGGRLVMPVGIPGNQRLCKLMHLRSGEWDLKMLEAVNFVPLIADPEGEEESGV